MSKRQRALSRRSHGRARRQKRPARPIRSARRATLLLCAVGVGVVLATTVAVVIASTSHQNGGAASPLAERRRLQKQVAALFAGIPQHGAILGQLTAPVTLQVFVDLEDHGDGTTWFDFMLPPILEAFVRRELVRLEFHSLKTDTLNGGPFITQQTAALAAGAQNQLWNYAAMFVNEQGPEFTNYVTEAFVTGIAEQVPVLDVAEWERSRSVAMSKIVMTDNYDARHRLGLFATPAFRIGLTGGRMQNFSGHTILDIHKYIVRARRSGERYIAGVSPEWQHPVALVDASDLKKAVGGLLCPRRDGFCPALAVGR